MLELLNRLVHTLVPLTQDKLQHFISDVGSGTFYAVLVAIVFCETGLVVLPFLPGDSLLFAVGAIGSSGDAPFSLMTVAWLLVLAALAGDNVNYWIGRRVGPAVFSREDSRLLSRKHLARTQAFYDRHGPKMVILARFVPIVRTFAPFVAGVGSMAYGRFLLFSAIGAVTWVGVCLSAGAMLGGLPFVKKHFEIIVLVIVFISVLPMGIEVLRGWARAKHQSRPSTQSPPSPPSPSSPLPSPAPVGSDNA